MSVIEKFKRDNKLHIKDIDLVYFGYQKLHSLSSLNEFKNLKILWLNNNDLSHIRIDYFSKLNKLQELYLHNNKLNCDMGFLKDIKLVNILYINNNKLNDFENLFINLKKMKCLNELQMFGNEFTVNYKNRIIKWGFPQGLKIFDRHLLSVDDYKHSSKKRVIIKKRKKKKKKNDKAFYVHYYKDKSNFLFGKNTYFKIELAIKLIDEYKKECMMKNQKLYYPFPRSTDDDNIFTDDDSKLKRKIKINKYKMFLNSYSKYFGDIFTKEEINGLFEIANKKKSGSFKNEFIQIMKSKMVEFKNKGNELTKTEYDYKSAYEEYKRNKQKESKESSTKSSKKSKNSNSNNTSNMDKSSTESLIEFIKVSKIESILNDFNKIT